ncbi:hypothetical protein F2Q69_00035929 [Brassica cretica]|uniref:Uncharacterized protein n=1 Tax=Brassica cretica TaxID=69181 RepID=A0A8S9SRE5_BRACR|nr:hypothetical protein F2Q69_00035929 [Brassica cretica]
MGSLRSSGDSIEGQTRRHGLMSYRCFGRARSLRSDRAEHVFGCCVATLFELLSDDSCFFRKAFRKEESISKKYLSKKVSTFSSSRILTVTSSQPFLAPTVSPPQLVRVVTLAGGLTISAKLGVLNEVYFKLHGREFSRKCLLKI